jgi:hypothetical protein
LGTAEYVPDSFFAYEKKNKKQNQETKCSRGMNKHTQHSTETRSISFLTTEFEDSIYRYPSNHTVFFQNSSPCAQLFFAYKKKDQKKPSNKMQHRNE